jgi:hypothetical protein
MAKKTITATELVVSHMPKNFKYKYIIKDPTLNEELLQENFDLSTLDTIKNEPLTDAALQASYVEYDRSTVSSAKKPTILEDGIILSKSLVTKADKKLHCVKLGRFDVDDVTYLSFLFEYDRFDILEIFILS